MTFLLVLTLQNNIGLSALFPILFSPLVQLFLVGDFAEHEIFFFFQQHP